MADLAHETTNRLQKMTQSMQNLSGQPVAQPKISTQHLRNTKVQQASLLHQCARLSHAYCDKRAHSKKRRRLTQSLPVHCARAAHPVHRQITTVYTLTFTNLIIRWPIIMKVTTIFTLLYASTWHTTTLPCCLHNELRSYSSIHPSFNPGNN